MRITRWLRLQWDRVSAVVLMVCGVVALALGFQGVANAVLPAGQIPYVLSGGVGGLFALGAGATLWLAAELRDQWHKLDSLEHELRAARLGGQPADVVVETLLADDADSQGGVRHTDGDDNGARRLRAPAVAKDRR